MKCLECGTDFTRTRRAGSPKRFCSAVCRNTFNNRAQMRGAEIYHLFRNMRRNRAEAKALNLWTEMCRIELRWEDEDREAGRVMPSYKSAKTTLYDMEMNDKKPTTNLYLTRTD